MRSEGAMKQTYPTVIGAFVLGAIGLIVAAILFFGSGTLFKKHYAMIGYFHGSVAGLQVGAPVNYRGVHVGEVTAIGIRIDPDTTRSIAQVNMELVPGGVDVHGAAVPGPGNPIPALVQRGLSAQLVLQSIVTGQLQVELDFRPNVQAFRLGEPSDVPEVPTVPSSFQALSQQLETLDIAAAVSALQHTAVSLDALVSNPQLKKTLDGLPVLLTDLRRTVGTIEREVTGSSAAAQQAFTGTAASMQKTLASVQSLAESLQTETAGTLDTARGTLQSANVAIENANALLDPNGDTLVQVQHAVDDLASSAARLRSFTERVDRNPAVLLHGR